MEIKRDEYIFYIGDNKDKPKAFISFEDGKDNEIVVTHTVVDPELRGQGIAGKLVEEVIEFAKSENRKIIPICSYVLDYFQKHPEHEDLLAD